MSDMPRRPPEGPAGSSDALAQAEAQLAAIEGMNTLADAMDNMKRAMESRGWTTVMSEQIGAQFGAMLMAMSAPGGGKS